MVGTLILRYFNNLCRVVAWISVVFLLPCSFALAQERLAIQTVVIDAGHGGKDPGAVGRRIHEKDLVLAVALKVGNLIQRNMPDVRVIYTRDKDQFIELYERANIANRNNADLFISIHANANNSRLLRGAETYIMGLHRSQANLEIAKLENSSILLESDYTANYAGFDPNSDESYITFSLYQNANLELSSQFASNVQSEMKDRVGLNDRGVRQAGFLVLYKTTMPSALVEIGYLSNAEEEAFMISENGKDYIASAIYRAFRSYKTSVESGQGSLGSSHSQTINSSAPLPSQTQKPLPNSDIVFRIQLAASPEKINTSSAKFKGLRNIYEYKHNGMYKYTWGEEYSYPGAVTLQSRVQAMGFTDAFIVAFHKGRRIAIDDACAIIRQ